MAQNVFDIVPEDPQEPHISQHVQPAAVEEHGGQKMVDTENGPAPGRKFSIKAFRLRIRSEDFEQKDQHDYDDHQHIVTDRPGVAAAVYL